MCKGKEKLYLAIDKKEKQQMKNKKALYSTKWIAYTAMLTALVVATQLIPPIPTPAGNIYWVDGVVLIAAYLMDPLSSFIVGGVGTLIYDMLYSPGMMLTSLLTHGLQGAVVSFLLHIIFPLFCNKNREYIWALLSSLAGAVVVVLGYFCYRWAVKGLPVAVASIPRNLLQEAIGITLAMVLCYATTFKRQLAKCHLLPDFRKEVLNKGDDEPTKRAGSDTSGAQKAS
jgi:uncharacterized membrane protein